MDYVYNLKRISKTKVKKQYAFPVMFAQKVENKIHRIYKRKRIEDITDTLYKFWDRHTKIGFSNNPKKRINGINESELYDGRTEYFDLNVIDRVVIFFILLFYCLLPFLGLAALGLLVYLMEY